MADPIRLRIQKALSAELASISTADGYNYSLTAPGQVVRGRIQIGDDDPVPLVSILEVPIPPGQHEAPYASDSFDGPWDIIVQGWVRDDPLNPTDTGHYLMQDVKKKLREVMRRASGSNFKRDYILGEQNIIGMSITPGVVRPAESPSRLAFFWLSVRIELVEPIGE